MTDHEEEITTLPLEDCLEALLFVAPGPVNPTQLAAAMDLTVEEVEHGLDALDGRLKTQCGLRLQRHAGRVQLTTSPELASRVERFLGLEASSRLSRAAMETLAIIAYQQPVTRPQVDSVRGVNSDGVIKSLLSKGLIQEAGRAEGPGRPIMYNTTPEFLQYFGLSSINELPELEPVENGPEASASPREILKD